MLFIVYLEASAKVHLFGVSLRAPSKEMKRTLCGVMVACKAIIGVLEFVVIKGVCTGFEKVTIS